MESKVVVSTPLPQRKLILALLSVALAAFVLAAYGTLFSRGGEFFRVDDGDYVVNNAHVRAGLTPANLVWAFTTFEAWNWHPLTWLSLMLDYEIFGLEPGGFHLTNVLLHAANSVLLLLVLERLTKAQPRHSGESNLDNLAR